MTYIVAEPLEQTVYTDRAGRHHVTRDLAIAANFELDFQKALYETGKATIDPSPEPGELSAFMHLLKMNHPDLIRVLMGDRDAT